MLEHLKKYFSTQVEQPTAKADIEKEVVNMTQATEQPIAAEDKSADLVAQLASQTSALTELQASFAELNNKYTEAAAKLAEVEAAKASLVADAAAAKLAARKEKLEMVVGDVKAAALLTTLEGLDDSAFSLVVESMTTTLNAEAQSPLFVQSGVTAEAAEVKPTHFNKNRKSK